MRVFLLDGHAVVSSRNVHAWLWISPWTWTVTYNLDHRALLRVKVNEQAKYLGQSHFDWKVSFGQTHTHTTDQPLYLDHKLVSNTEQGKQIVTYCAGFFIATAGNKRFWDVRTEQHEIKRGKTSDIIADAPKCPFSILAWPSQFSFCTCSRRERVGISGTDFLWVRCPSCHPTNSVEAPKETKHPTGGLGSSCLHPPPDL